jgi:hypothetical protein
VTKPHAELGELCHSLGSEYVVRAGKPCYNPAQLATNEADHPINTSVLPSLTVLFSIVKNPEGRRYVIGTSTPSISF